MSGSPGIQSPIEWDVTSDTTGYVHGVQWTVRNGLLDLLMDNHYSSTIIEEFKNRIKEVSRKEKSTVKDFLDIHRMARMCWELTTKNQLTNLDSEDAGLLYDIKQEASFEWVFTIMNGVRFLLRTTSCSIAVADHMAKSMDELMNS